MSDQMRAVLPAVLRLANAPGQLLARAGTIMSASFFTLGVLAARQRPGVLPTILLIVAAAALAAALTFAFRRRRLQLGVDAAEESLAAERARDAAAPAVPLTFDEEVRANSEQLSAFHTERSLRRDTWLPGVEATQRALLRAAGGPQAAPYLRDDLRITGIALLGTLAALPLSLLGSFFALLHLLG